METFKQTRRAKVGSQTNKNLLCHWTSECFGMLSSKAGISERLKDIED